MKKTLSGFLAATVLISAVHAGTFNVTRLDDPVPDGCGVNDCSLREAVIDADQTLMKDTIVLPAGVYLIDLTGNDTSENTGDLDISTDMEIVGAPSIIDGQELGRIMDIRSDAKVTLRDLTLRDANTSLDTNGALNGGALQINGGSLTLETVTFENNSTQSLGGAIYAFGDAVVDIGGCLFINNSASNGAGIFASTGVTVRNTVFQGNHADLSALGRGGAAHLTGSTSDSLFEDVTLDQNLGTGSGGGILFLGRSLLIDGLIATGNESTTRSGGALTVPGTAHAKQVEIVNALFDGNTAQDDGGAISFADDDDTLDIRHSSFVSNVAADNGGALYLTGGDVDVTNDTFSGNQATDDGGAIYLFGAGLTLYHATFSGGSANRGNALAVAGSSGISAAELANNLIDGDCFVSDVESVTSLGGNVEGTGDSCELNTGSDLVSQSNAQLGLQPLADNVGGTPTHKLTPASVARGQGEPAICELVKIDQLFESRGSVCNSGADESNTIFRDGFESS
jgi:predicted outer membrane repeat protein